MDLLQRHMTIGTFGTELIPFHLVVPKIGGLAQL
jgi:hypothetical protein